MTLLGDLFDKYGSDKNSVHSYAVPYTMLFTPLRSAQRILEVGVMRGASLKAWRDFFPYAYIYGVDNGEDCGLWPYDESPRPERINTYYGDSRKPDTLQEIADNLGCSLDIVIDDGSHDPYLQVATFAALWPYVRSGGIYVTEDILRIEDANRMAELFGGEVIDLRKAKRRDDDILWVKKK